jgi:mannose-6-phosphate isomerase-like protein (cupin superfamily)
MGGTRRWDGMSAESVADAGRRSVEIRHLEEGSFAAIGRRSFAHYRDLGLKAASGGRQGAVVVNTNDTAPPPTGWHYHTCEVQFVYVLRGSVVLELEDGTSERLVPGSCITIPGGVRHNESSATPDIEVLEVTVPADMDTVPVDGPTG